MSSQFGDDEDEWQDMPVVCEDELKGGLDEEDQKKYHYICSPKRDTFQPDTGAGVDLDHKGAEWRSKSIVNENEYTRLRIDEDNDETYSKTRHLFDEDKAMTPLSQMQATKDFLTEAQRIAYVGLCALLSRGMVHNLKMVKRKELELAIESMEHWRMKVMSRLYYHMELETEEQAMINSLADNGVQATDLVPALMVTRTIANPEYDPKEPHEQASNEQKQHDKPGEDSNDHTTTSSLLPTSPHEAVDDLSETAQPATPVVTTLSSTDENVTLDVRWTILCDLFLILIADGAYDARSRVLLETVASKLGLSWLDVVKFERRVTEALEIQEDIEKMEQREVIEGRREAGRNKRYMMMGLATIGGGLVLGLSAGLLAPVIGAGLGTAFATVGITGTTGFLAGTGGAAVITGGGVLTGSSMAGRSMGRRTQSVRTFDILPLHNNRRVSCIVTVPGFMSCSQDDVRLPFSVLDPIVGDVFSVLWEPDMICETGNLLKILTGEVLFHVGQTVLHATVMNTLMGALQWPIILTKLRYIIDNPWNNALDRAKVAGSILADILVQRRLGVRPVTLVGYSLGARVIFYALQELAAQKGHGIVQDVFLLGATVTVSTKCWCEVRSIVSGRFVNGFATNDWVLNYLFRATTGGLNTVAGLRPIENVPDLENVDVTHQISGHMSYRTFMPLILKQLGFSVTADHFDDLEEAELAEDHTAEKKLDQPKRQSWFSRSPAGGCDIPKKKVDQSQKQSWFSWTFMGGSSGAQKEKDSQSKRQSWFGKKQKPPPLELPKASPSPWPQIFDSPTNNSALSTPELVPSSLASRGSETPQTPGPSTPLGGHVGFDFNAIKRLLANEESKFGIDHTLPTPPMPTTCHANVWLDEGTFLEEASTLPTTLPSSHCVI